MKDAEKLLSKMRNAGLRATQYALLDGSLADIEYHTSKYEYDQTRMLIVRLIESGMEKEQQC